MSKVTKTQVEKKLNVAVSHATPDIKEAILAKCNETNTKYVPMSTSKFNKMKYKRAVLSRIAVAVAAILLLVNIGIIGLKGTAEKQVFTTIDIDVNPSIEIKINNHDRVVAVNAVNEDAIIILDGMDLTGATTNVAVNALLGSMLSHGYLTDDTRTVLVSVDSNDKANAVRVQEDIAKDIGNMLNTYSVQATVVSQTMTIKDEEVATLAGEYGISQGKAEFVQKIVDANDNYSEQDIEALSQMSVTELDTILTDAGATGDVVQVITTGSSEDDLIVVATDEVADNKGDESSDDNNNDNTNDNNVNEVSSKAETSNEKDNTIENRDSVDSVSDNSVSDNSVSSNSVSNNSVSNNSVSDNSIKQDLDSNNSKNAVSSNSVSNNTVSNNSVSKNNANKNDTKNDIKNDAKNDAKNKN